MKYDELTDFGKIALGKLIFKMINERDRRIPEKLPGYDLDDAACYRAALGQFELECPHFIQTGIVRRGQVVATVCSMCGTQIMKI